MQKKLVAVMMPFGGIDPKQQRRCILDFMRIKYLIEKKIEVTPQYEDEGRKQEYEVRAFQAKVGEIPENAIKLIEKADVLVGLITEKNVNVIYELALRSLLRDVPILIVKGDPDDLLPIYLRNQAYIRYDDGSQSPVGSQIESTAKSEFPILTLNTEIPGNLTQAIDAHDSGLKGDLQTALQEMERPRQHPFRELLTTIVSDLNPEGMLKPWTTYYPSSTVMMKWKKRSRGVAGYAPADMDGDAIVCTYNQEFLNLYNFHDVDQTGPLTQTVLLEQLKNGGFVDPNDFGDFLNDQVKLTEKIVMGNGFGEASVPLRIGPTHPRTEHRNKAYLPCLTAKRIVGDQQRPHCMYLLISYIDIAFYVRGRPEVSEAANGSQAAH